MSDGLPPYLGFAGLWRLESSGLEIARLGPMLEARLASDPGNAEAMMDIATLSILTLIPENRPYAFAMQARALDLQQVYPIPAPRQPATLRVLAVACPGDMTAITHLDCLLEGSDVDLLMLYLRAGSPLPQSLPEHDLVFVAIGESGPNRQVLALAKEVATLSSRPVINPAARILALTRDTASRMLRDIPGVTMPPTTRVARDRLLMVAAGTLLLEAVLPGGAFPIIARPVDSQGGAGLEKLDDAGALASYLDGTAFEAYFVSRFVDYSGADGHYRKFRVVMVEGQALACHMAISTQWMIHYVNADMDASDWKRAEEARFMVEFDTGFATRHAGALQGIDAALGLDYYAIDCAETREGALLVFEADTAMLVHAMDPVDLYPYKGPAMRRIFEAFRRMLETRKESARQAARQ